MGTIKGQRKMHLSRQKGGQKGQCVYKYTHFVPLFECPDVVQIGVIKK